jgi:hypothetical protein
LYDTGLVSQRVTIGSLCDDALIEIFHFYRSFTIEYGGRPQSWYRNWHKLVHVCQRWRFVLFGYPRTFDLQILCTAKAPARKLLNVWPAFPLNIYFHPMSRNLIPKENLDNLIAALEHTDRVSEVDITFPPGPLWDQVVAVMQEPFPAMTHLSFRTSSGRGLHLPGTFLNGSAPRLKNLRFSGVSFPFFPRLLLSATDLTILFLNPITEYLVHST